MTDLGFTTPTVPEAEALVLGSMLHIPEVIGLVTEHINADDFTVPKNRTIFEVIVALENDAKPQGAVSVLTELRRTGDHERVGGGDYLATLITKSLPASVVHFAQIIAEAATKRRLIAFHQRGIQQAAEGSGLDLGELLSTAQADFDALNEGSTANADVIRIGDALQPTLDHVDDLGKGTLDNAGVPTGFPDLDRVITGLFPGQMIVVAARPAVGKSTFGLDLARHAAIRNNLTTAIFSLEMSREEITMRCLSAELNLDLGRLRKGQLEDQEWQRISAEQGRIADAPLFIDDSASITMSQIRLKARRLKQRFDLKLIVIDYLQLMTGDKRTESRQQEVSEISRSVKLLAKELGIPVVVMSQLNRGSEQRADKKPMISDIRESGSIEQDADVVILMYREDQSDPESTRTGECDLIVAKQRNGPTGTIPVAAQLHYSKFVPLAPEWGSN